MPPLINFEGTLRAAKRGNEDAFATIWREFHPGLLRYLKVKAAPDAEDLAADIWHRVIHRATGIRRRRRRLSGLAVHLSSQSNY